MKLHASIPEEAIAEGSVYWEVWREIKKMDLHKQGMPPHLGGVTLTPLQSCIVLEELGWGSTARSGFVAAPAGAARAASLADDPPPRRPPPPRPPAHSPQALRHDEQGGGGPRLRARGDA